MLSPRSFGPVKRIQPGLPRHMLPCIITITIHTEKVITEIAFTASSNTHYMAPMPAGSRKSQVKGGFSSQDLQLNCDTPYSACQSLCDQGKVGHIQRRWLMLNRSNTEISPLTPEIPRFFPSFPQLVVHGSIITTLSFP